MDYQTKPTSRKKLRVLSKVFRAIFGLNEIELVPVLKMLEKLPAYCSVEWQTKALCGEVMMPYEQTKNMTQREIMEKYQVSKGFAKTRRHY